MAAGLGFKDFVTGEVLTAADVDGYLMQGVWVFASAAARDAAVTSPQEGNFAYLKDTNVTTYYTGSAWANLDTTGMTNPMTTTGDTIYSSSGSTPARLGIGSTGNVLTVAGGVPTWAAPAGGGGMTLLDTLTLSGASVTSTTFSSSYKQLLVYVKKAYGSAAGLWKMRMNGNTGNNYSWQHVFFGSATSYSRDNNVSYYRIGYLSDSTSASRKTYSITTITRPSDSDVVFINTTEVFGENPSTNFQGSATGNFSNDTDPITSITLFPDSGTFSGGEAFIYGVN